MASYQAVPARCSVLVDAAFPQPSFFTVAASDSRQPHVSQDDRQDDRHRRVHVMGES